MTNLSVVMCPDITVIADQRLWTNDWFVCLCPDITVIADWGLWTNDWSVCGQDEPTEEEEEDNYTIPLRQDIQENLAMMQKTYNEIFEATYSADQMKNLQQNPATSNDLFNMTDIFIRRLIKFAKCIPEFKELKQEDQINLLKVFIYKDFHHSDMFEQEWLQSALSVGCVGQKDV